MNEIEREAWIFDSVLGFLKSPMWVNPIQGFIDNYCLVFNRDEEHKFPYTEVHNEFRALIEQLLSKHLREMGITDEEFFLASQEHKNKELNRIVKEYILAMDDFVTFKKMMEKRNLQLEYEALKSLKQAAAKKKAEEEAKRKAEEELKMKEAQELQEKQEKEYAKLSEEDLIQMAIEASIEDQEVVSKELEKEEAELRAAIALSLALSEKEEEEAIAKAEQLLSTDDNQHQEERSQEQQEEKTQEKAVEDETSTSTEKKIEEKEDAEEMKVEEEQEDAEEAEEDPVKSIVKEREASKANAARQEDPEIIRQRELEAKKFKELQALIQAKKTKKSMFTSSNMKEEENSSKKEEKQEPLKLLPLRRPLLKKKLTTVEEKKEARNNLVDAERERLVATEHARRAAILDAYQAAKKAKEAQQLQPTLASVPNEEDAEKQKQAALHQKLRAELGMSSFSVAKPKHLENKSIADMSKRLKELEKLRRERDQKKALDEQQRKKALQNMFNNIQTIEEDEFNFKEGNS